MRKMASDTDPKQHMYHGPHHPLENLQKLHKGRRFLKRGTRCMNLGRKLRLRRLVEKKKSTMTTRRRRTKQKGLEYRSQPLVLWRRLRWNQSTYQVQG